MGMVRSCPYTKEGGAWESLGMITGRLADLALASETKDREIDMMEIDELSCIHMDGGSMLGVF